MLIKRESTDKLKKDLKEVRVRQKSLMKGTRFADPDEASFYDAMVRREREVVKELKIRGEYEG